MDLTLSERIMYNVVHITMLNSTGIQIGMATGFIFGFCENGNQRIPCLVTNRHVLSKCPKIKITFTKEKSPGVPDIGNLLPVELSTLSAEYHPNPSIDLAVLPIGDLINNLTANGEKVFYVMYTIGNIPSADEWNKYSAIENVVMAGFPKGFRDEVNNQPIFRSGITATHPALNFKGKPVFLIDMPCYEGCSGSPVMVCDEGLHIDKRSNSISAGNKISLLGVQYAIPFQQSIGQLATIPTDSTTTVPVVPLYINLGFIIKSTELLIFDDILRAKYNP